MLILYTESCQGFVQTEDKLLDLEEILKLLPAPDIQELAKSMHILNKNEGKTKKQLTQSLLKHSQKQCSLFANNGNRIEKAIVKRYGWVLFTFNL